MAFPTAVNSQITDATAQANAKTLGSAPAVALGSVYQATAQALANAAHNATATQQSGYEAALASTNQGVASLYALDTATASVAPRPR